MLFTNIMLFKKMLETENLEHKLMREVFTDLMN